MAPSVILVGRKRPPPVGTDRRSLNKARPPPIYLKKEEEVTPGIRRPKAKGMFASFRSRSTSGRQNYPLASYMKGPQQQNKLEPLAAQGRFSRRVRTENAMEHKGNAAVSNSWPRNRYGEALSSLGEKPAPQIRNQRVSSQNASEDAGGGGGGSGGGGMGSLRTGFRNLTQITGGRSTVINARDMVTSGYAALRSRQRTSSGGEDRPERILGSNVRMSILSPRAERTDDVTNKGVDEEPEEPKESLPPLVSVALPSVALPSTQTVPVQSSPTPRSRPGSAAKAADGHLAAIKS